MARLDRHLHQELLVLVIGLTVDADFDRMAMDSDCLLEVHPTEKLLKSAELHTENHHTLLLFDHLRNQQLEEVR